MPWVRTVLLGDDDVIVQVKRWGWPKGWDVSWSNKTKLSAARNSVEKEVDDLIGKLYDKLESLQDIKESLRAEVDEVKLSKHTGFGQGTPFYMTDKRLKEWAKPDIRRPDIDSWRTFFHQLVVREYDLFKESSRKDNHSNNSRPVKGNPPFQKNEQAKSDSGTTTYTLNGLSSTVQHSVDNPVIEFKEEKKGGSSDSHKEKMRQLRKDNPKYPDEDHKEYEQRINDLSRN